MEVKDNTLFATKYYFENTYLLFSLCYSVTSLRNSVEQLMTIKRNWHESLTRDLIISARRAIVGYEVSQRKKHFKSNNSLPAIYHQFTHIGIFGKT